MKFKKQINKGKVYEFKKACKYKKVYGCKEV